MTLEEDEKLAKGGKQENDNGATSLGLNTTAFVLNL
jgi:hypothetical protein